MVLGHDAAAIDWLEAHNGAARPRAAFFCLNVTLHSRACADSTCSRASWAPAAPKCWSRQLQRNERGIPAHASTTMIPALWVDGPTLAPRS